MYNTLEGADTILGKTKYLHHRPTFSLRKSLCTKVACLCANLMQKGGRQRARVRRGICCVRLAQEFC